MLWNALFHADDRGLYLYNPVTGNSSSAIHDDLLRQYRQDEWTRSINPRRKSSK